MWSSGSAVTLPAMIEKFARAFVSNGPGAWLCVQPAHIVGPQGPFTTTPGITYRRGKLNQGYDIAEWLDTWHNHQREPIGVAFL